MVNETAEKAALQVDAAEFAAKCLELLDEVARSGGEVVITRNGRPVSRLVACVDQPAAPDASDEFKSMFGADRGRLRILGDIVSPMPVEWYTDPDQGGNEGEDGKSC